MEVSPHRLDAIESHKTEQQVLDDARRATHMGLLVAGGDHWQGVPVGAGKQSQRPNLRGMPNLKQVVRELFPARFGDKGRQSTTAVPMPAMQENMSTRVGCAKAMAALQEPLRHGRGDLSIDISPLVTADEAVQSMNDGSSKNVACKLFEEGLAPAEDEPTARNLMYDVMTMDNVGAPFHFLAAAKSAILITDWDVFEPLKVLLGLTGIDPKKAGQHEPKKMRFLLVVLRALNKIHELKMHQEMSDAQCDEIWTQGGHFDSDKYLEVWFGYLESLRSVPMTARSATLLLKLVDVAALYKSGRNGCYHHRQVLTKAIIPSLVAANKHNISRDQWRQMDGRRVISSERKNEIAADLGSLSRTGNEGHDVECDEWYEILVGKAKSYVSKYGRVDKRLMAAYLAPLDAMFHEPFRHIVSSLLNGGHPPSATDESHSSSIRRDVDAVADLLVRSGCVDKDDVHAVPSPDFNPVQLAARSVSVTFDCTEEFLGERLWGTGACDQGLLPVLATDKVFGHSKHLFTGALLIGATFGFPKDSKRARFHALGEQRGAVPFRTDPTAGHVPANAPGEAPIPVVVCWSGHAAEADAKMEDEGAGEDDGDDVATPNENQRLPPPRQRRLEAARLPPPPYWRLRAAPVVAVVTMTSDGYHSLTRLCVTRTEWSRVYGKGMVLVGTEQSHLVVGIGAGWVVNSGRLVPGSQNQTDFSDFGTLEAAIASGLSEPGSSIQLRLLPLQQTLQSTSEAFVGGGIPPEILLACNKITIHVVPPGAPMRTAKRDMPPSLPTTRAPATAISTALGGVDDTSDSDSDSGEDDSVIDLSGSLQGEAADDEGRGIGSSSEASARTNKQKIESLQRMLMSSAGSRSTPILDRLETPHDAQVATESPVLPGSHKESADKSGRSNVQFLSEQMHGTSFATKECKFFKSAVQNATKSRSVRWDVLSCLAGHLPLKRQQAAACVQETDEARESSFESSHDGASSALTAMEVQSQLRVLQLEAAAAVKARLAATKKLAALRARRHACTHASIRAVSLPKQTHVTANASLADAAGAEASELDDEIKEAAARFDHALAQVADIERRRGLLLANATAPTPVAPVVTGAPAPVAASPAALTVMAPAPRTVDESQFEDDNGAPSLVGIDPGLGDSDHDQEIGAGGGGTEEENSGGSAEDTGGFDGGSLEDFDETEFLEF